MWNESAVIGGHAYRLIKLLPSLDGVGQYVLCADGEGGQYVCPKSL